MQGRVGVALVEALGGAAQHQAGGLEFGRHVGELELQGLEIGEALAELAAFEHVGPRRLPAGPRAAQGAGADIEPAAVEPHHRDRKPLALGAEPVGDRHPALGEITAAVGWVFQPSFFSFLPKDRPGVPFSTTRHEMPLRPGLAGAHHHDIEVAAAAARDEGLDPFST